jgi:hypothetical protein
MNRIAHLHIAATLVARYALARSMPWSGPVVTAAAHSKS